MMAFGGGGPLMRRRVAQHAAPPPPIMAEVMQLRPIQMPQAAQMTGGFAGGLAGGLADGLRRMMAQRTQMQSAYPVAGRTLLERLFGADPSLGSRIPAQRPVLTPYGLGDMPIGGLY